MSSTRRSFGKTTGMVIGGMVSGLPARVLGGLSSAGAAQAASTQAVLDFVSPYSSRVINCGASVASQQSGSFSPHVNLIAEIGDRSAFENFFVRAQGERKIGRCVSVSGNDFSFESGGACYSVNNLSPAAYSEQLEALQSGEGRFFSHQTLTQPLAEGSLSSNLTHTIKPLVHLGGSSYDFPGWYFHLKGLAMVRL
jgi:hypothetical protein